MIDKPAKGPASIHQTIKVRIISAASVFGTRHKSKRQPYDRYHPQDAAACYHADLAPKTTLAIHELSLSFQQSYVYADP